MNKFRFLLAACAAFSFSAWAGASPAGPSFDVIAQTTDFPKPGKPAVVPPPPPMIEFEPPPVPDFMLRKPEKPLTTEEMQRQADEAAERARKAKATGGKVPPAPGSNTDGSGTSSR